MVTLIQLQLIKRDNFPETQAAFRLGFYAVYLKQLKGSMGYGRSHYDFDQEHWFLQHLGKLLQHSVILPTTMDGDCIFTLTCYIAQG